MACVLVHGRDQDEAVMLDVAERCALDDVSYLLLVAAGRGWYPGRYFDTPSENDAYLLAAIEPAATARAAGAADEYVCYVRRTKFSTGPNVALL